MVTLNKIYTRTGDDGSTGLVGGSRIKKNSIRVTAYGDIDELNSHLGLCATLCEQLNAALPALQSFVLPGGSVLNSQLHIARCVCRRAERAIITLHDVEPVNESIRHYVNRLSDLLFVMSRSAACSTGSQEVLWVPGASRTSLP